jgi:hypothetical protein
MRNLLNNVKITRVLNRGAGSASATPSKGTIVDMDGYDSVCFIAAMQDVVNLSVVSLRAASASTNSTGAMALLEGTVGGTADASSFDNKLLVLDVVNPPHRYVEVQLFHVTQNAPFDSVVAILYNSKAVPVVQDATVVAAGTIDSPVAA